MKNIHVLPTDKATRLFIADGKLFNYHKTQQGDGVKIINQNIYITSPNEDINEDDYIITKDGRLVQVSYLLSKDLQGAYKVILTTNDLLIKDGVQAIDDEFLEWFVKNPSCEEIDVAFACLEVRQCMCDSNAKCLKQGYEIIIPKEEPKQETLEDAMRQNGYHDKVSDDLWREGAEFGTKWQEERMYSEEDMLEFGKFCHNDAHSTNRVKTFKELLEQFKKK